MVFRAVLYAFLAVTALMPQNRRRQEPSSHAAARWRGTDTFVGI